MGRPRTKEYGSEHLIDQSDLMVYDHTHPAYRRKHGISGNNFHNGAYYYSIEIVENIMPLVKTDRPWVTVNIEPYAQDRAIVFIHNNKNTERYDWLERYNDLILVCGVPETCDKVKHLGTPIYLPLSIDIGYVKQFMVPEENRVGEVYVGRKAKRKWKCSHIPKGTECIEGVDRETLLRKMATYKSVYAVGRVAIEAKALGCDVLPYDERYPDPGVWKVVDNKEAAEMLQEKLNEIEVIRNAYEE